MLITPRTEMNDLASDAVHAGMPVLSVAWDAVTYEQRPELFETPTARQRLPWPLEPHNRGPIAESDWKLHRLDAADEQGHLLLGNWVEQLLDCEHHPGMIVRGVRVSFAEEDDQRHATLVAPVLPPMLSRR